MLWSGRVGGAEAMSFALSERMRRLGHQPTVVFVEDAAHSAAGLEAIDVPFRALGLPRGRTVVRHPRKLARAVGEVGADGALVLERGYLGASLRCGGYRGPVVAVEHGAMLISRDRLSRPRRAFSKLNRLCGAWADDVEVAVSDYMMERMRAGLHAPRVARIYNGIDPDRWSCSPSSDDDSRALVVGTAHRLVRGKGTDALIRAVVALNGHVPAKLLISGDGPERTRLAALCHELGGEGTTEFVGEVADTVDFWRRCDIATVPSHTFIESFSMATLEAMACAKAIVASRNGAIPELVVDGVTGTLVAPGDSDELRHALHVYARRPELRRAHGDAAARRARKHFHIDDTARAYLQLFEDVRKRRSATAS